MPGLQIGWSMCSCAWRCSWRLWQGACFVANGTNHLHLRRSPCKSSPMGGSRVARTIHISELVHFWRNEQLHARRKSIPLPSIILGQQPFWCKCGQWAFFKKDLQQRVVCEQILQLLDREGDCPSVVNVQGDVEGAWDENTYRILAQDHPARSFPQCGRAGGTVALRGPGLACDPGYHGGRPGPRSGQTQIPDRAPSIPRENIPWPPANRSLAFQASRNFPGRKKSSEPSDCTTRCPRDSWARL